MRVGSGSFARMATITASTERMGAVADGLSGDLAERVASLKCLPLDPLSPDVAQMAGIGAFAELLSTLTEETDILEGDVLYVNSTSYKIRAVAEWPWGPTGSDTLLLILEEVK